MNCRRRSYGSSFIHSSLEVAEAVGGPRAAREEPQVPALGGECAQSRAVLRDAPAFDEVGGADEDGFRRAQARVRLARQFADARREPRRGLCGAAPRALLAQNLAPLLQKERRARARRAGVGHTRLTSDFRLLTPDS